MLERQLRYSLDVTCAPTEKHHLVMRHKEDVDTIFDLISRCCCRAERQSQEAEKLARGAIMKLEMAQKKLLMANESLQASFEQKVPSICLIYITTLISRRFRAKKERLLQWLVFFVSSTRWPTFCALCTFTIST